MRRRELFEHPSRHMIGTVKLNVDREHFRHCIYCTADCAQEKPEHAADCPTNTGLFPISIEDVLEKMICGGCKKPFEIGDKYMHRDIREEDIADDELADALEPHELLNDPDHPVKLSICMECAMRDSILAP